ncbi:MAG: protein kinase [Chloroflexi bacterium]|nr:protein kinase [Chloroflexota bacterium]
MANSSLPSLVADRYLPESELGSGGMGTVYRARDLHTGTTVAVKLIRPDVLIESPELLTRFIREGETLRRLNHPNIVKLLDAVQAGNQHFLVMEYMEHGDLRGLIAEQGRFTVARTLAIAVELTDALARAHHLRIIHRDLKPANVLIAADGTPRLTDFGVARLISTADIGSTGEGNALGTPAYMPPEALAGEPVDAAADLWAFGVVLFEMLAGTHPFAATSASGMIGRILTSAPDDLEKLRPDAPPALIDLIYRLLTKDRAQRISSARRVGALLEDISLPDAERSVIEDSPTVRSTPTETPRTPPETPGLPIAPNNLPAQTSVCVGREREIDSAETALSSSRLVTLVGMGGIGKTRLALEVAARMAARHLPDGKLAFPDGVYFVSLAPLPGADAIIGALADAVGQPFTADSRSPLEQVIDGLHAKTVLIVMDNFEHILDGAEIVRQILEGAPDVRVLATSRERLNLTSEFVVSLGGIDVTDIRQEFENHGAVALFMQAANRVNPALTWDSATLASVASISRKVHGVPLALILAAAWCDSLTPAEIDAELSRNYDLLEGELRDLPPRQRSVRAVFEYSWALISPEQRETFARLSIFRGGFTREAAQAVAGTSLRLLSVLQAKSLIRRDPDNGRYDIHPLLTQFAQAALAVLPAILLDTEAAYVAYFAKLDALEGQVTRRELEAQRVIELEFENLRAALMLAVQHGSEPEAIRLSLGLSLFCSTTCRFDDAYSMMNSFRMAPVTTTELLRAIIDLSEATVSVKTGENQRTDALAKSAIRGLDGTPYAAYASLARGLSAVVAMRAGEYGTAKELASRGATDAERLGLLRAEISSSFPLVWAELYSGEHALAISHIDKIIERIDQKGGPPSALGTAYLIKGEALHSLAHLADARKWFERGHETFQRTHNKVGIASSLVHLGNAALAIGDFAAARDYLRRSIALSREIGDRREEAAALNRLGGVDYQVSEFDTSYRNHEEALRLYRQLSDPRGAADSLVLLAIALEAIGDARDCKVILEEALAIRRSLGNPYEIVDVLINLGQMFFILREFDAAEACFAESDLILAEHPDLYLSNHSKFGQAYNMLMAGKYDAGLSLILEVIDYGQQYNVTWLIAYGRLAQAVSLALLGRMSEADEAAKQLCGIAQSIGNADLLGGGYIVRSIVRAVRGDWERTLAWVHFLMDRPQTSNMLRSLTRDLLSMLRDEAPVGAVERSSTRAMSVTLDEIETALMHDL